MRKLSLVLACVGLLSAAPLLGAGGYKLIAWNDLGMHCTDGVDYSVFGVLPPYNTVNAQLIDPSGKLVRNPGGITVTYEAVADTRGSVNTTSIGKTNFWQYVNVLFGAPLAPDVGLAGNAMPGSANLAKPVRFDVNRAWFTAEGVPVTPIDDRGNRNYFPMMRFTARDANGVLLATTDVVLPVSDEMDCSACHASGGSPAARPAIGWAWDPNLARDVKLNILAIHDQHQAANAKYGAALAAQSYDAAGLRATSLSGTPILCARCHPSNALPGLGIATIEPLTTAVHSRHSDVVDPQNGLSLEDAADRSSCYRCHPGAETKCLRGVMGAAVTGDAKFSIHCQSCHGSMSAVGAASRKGWLEEPNCQNCHTGTATTNAGAIRYLNAFASPGVLRVAPDRTFATNRDAPAAGLSLYRFSTGHGGLQCEACHGSTHAEFASTEANDNVQSMRMQAHEGMLSECTACHASMPSTVAGGPHGLHPLGASWVAGHGDAAEHDTSACTACHGADYRGTVLSRAQASRSISTEFGARTFWRGFQVGCYACHEGPDSERATRNRAPVASSASVSTSANTVVTRLLQATDADFNPLVLRVVSRPMHGRAGIDGTTATYVPDAGFAGNDSFTFAAWDGSIDSNLATVSIAVGAVVPNVRVSVTKTGSGSGVVTSSPAGINCGVSCSASVPSGTKIILTAQPDLDSRFDGWSGACTGSGPCTLTPVSDATVTANFTYAPSKYTLTVTKAGTGRGVVTSSPEGIDCGEKCSTTFALGTTVTLTAKAESTSTFAGWTGACSGTRSCVVSMTQQRAVTATFNPIAATRSRSVRH